MDEQKILKNITDVYHSRVLNFINKLQERNVEIINLDQIHSWNITLLGSNKTDYLHIYFYYDDTYQAFFTNTSKIKGNINVLVWPQSGLYDLSAVYGDLHGISSKIEYHSPSNTCRSIDQMLELALKWDKTIKEDTF